MQAQRAKYKSEHGVVHTKAISNHTSHNQSDNIYGTLSGHTPSTGEESFLHTMSLGMYGDPHHRVG